MNIFVYNSCNHVSYAEAKQVTSAVNIQLREHFTPSWSIQAQLTLAKEKAPKPKLSQKFAYDAVIFISESTKHNDALGFHDRAKTTGIPFAFVFRDLSEEIGEEWSVTFSHEVLELALNRHANCYAIGPHPRFKRNVAHWLEACDAVQDFSYDINKIPVSNFVLPRYFTPEAETGKNDFLKTRGLRSFGLAKGGYVGFFDPRTGREHTIFADQRAKTRFKTKEKLSIFRRKNRKPSF